MTMARNVAVLAMVATVALMASAAEMSNQTFVYLTPKTSSFWRDPVVFAQMRTTAGSPWPRSSHAS